MTPHLIALLWLLTPAPQNVIIDFPVTITNAVIQTNQLVPLSSIPDCETVCTAAWAAAGPGGTDKPFEMAAGDARLRVGKACRCLSGPGPKLRLDGSEQ